MSRRWAGRCLLAALVAVLGGLALLQVERVETASELAWARSLIATDDYARSRQRFERLERSLAARAEARAGLLLLDAVAGDQELPSARGVPRADRLSRFPLPAIFQRAMSELRFEGCLRLVELLRRAGRETFSEYEAAALLELGRVEEARAIALPAAPVTRFGRRLAQLLEGDRDLTRVPIRDRRGELLGTMAARGEGVFESESGIEESLVPRIAIERLAGIEPSGGVRLTIDLELSRQAYRALGNYRGSIVVIDPSSGDVLAAINDRRSWRAGGTPAFEQLREPASIAKLITVTAALRAGIDVDQTISEMNCRGAVAYAEGPIYCSSINGRLSGLAGALAVSCNVAFARLGGLVGRPALLAEYRRYGFDLGEGGAEFFGRVVEPYGSQRQLGELSIGLEVSEITPVHAALQAATFANGGRMFQPRIFESQDTFLGFSELVLPAAERRQLLDEAWLREIVSAMEAVVAPGGTANGVAPSDFPIALKTGTASDPRYGFHVNYIGFGPLPSARYAFAVRITHQRTSQRVRRAAYAVTARLLRALRDRERTHHVAVAAGSYAG